MGTLRTRIDPLAGKAAAGLCVCLSKRVCPWKASRSPGRIWVKLRRSGGSASLLRERKTWLCLLDHDLDA